MSVIAIIGMQWGDEGKGKIVDQLAAAADHVARFQGGHNAGHTIIRDGEKTVLHLLPSGVLHPQAQCHVGAGVVISLPDLLAEIAATERQVGDLRGRLFVSAAAALVLPYHIRMDEARDRQNNIGTTKRGIGPAHEDKVGRRAARVYDLYNGAGERKIARNVDFYNHQLVRHNCPPLAAPDLWRELQPQAERLRPYVRDDIGANLAAAAEKGENILLEGAQGALLDIENGTYPFTTSASCIAAAAAGGLGADLRPDVLGVIKSYCTRVGNGPFPTELRNNDGAALARRGDEFGATTGRPRRCGWLDLPMLRAALRVNGCRRLIVTKLDILDGMDEIKLCVAYDLDGKRRDLPPADPSALERCVPIYESLPGWKEKTASIADARQLPAAAERYLRRLEDLSGAVIDIISTGADPRAAIVRRSPFALS